MNDQFVSKILNLCVGKLINSLAINCASRLDLEYFESQLNSPSFNQSFPVKTEKLTAATKALRAADYTIL